MIDAHAHLTDPAFDPDREAVIERAMAAGLARVLTCGEDVASSERALELARAHPDLVRVAVGIHPHRAAGCDPAALSRLRELARDPLVVAIGEIGLDLSGRSAPIAAQRSALAAQLALAAELGLPVVLHMRDAPRELAEALVAAPRVRGQLHCYSQGPAEIDGWLGRGLAISFAGTVTFRNGARLREAAARVPGDRLLLETDAPYLAPDPHRGERNEPSRVAVSYALVASFRGTTVEELAARTAETARALFRRALGALRLSARRRAAIAAAALVAVAAAIGGWAWSADQAARLERGLARMEALEGFRFELVATVEAGGSAALAGPLRREARMTGEFAAPDRLHVSFAVDGAPSELVIVGDRQWINEGQGYHQTVATPLGPLRDARAPLSFLRGGGAASFAGIGFGRGGPTHRVRLDLSAGDLAARLFQGSAVPPDSRGVVEVELGLFDDLIRRQTVEITSGAEAFGSGIDRVRTSYTVEYWAHGQPQEVREPE